MHEVVYIKFIKKNILYVLFCVSNTEDTVIQTLMMFLSKNAQLLDLACTTVKTYFFQAK